MLGKILQDALENVPSNAEKDTDFIEAESLKVIKHE